MALLVLIALGATLGWLSSIIVRAEAARSILVSIGLGSAASLIAGLLMNSGGPLGGIDFISLGVGALAAIAALAIYNMVFVIRF
ncbi:MAG: hypothetical protein ABJP48_04105 [Erythrobacter sp.]